MGTTPGKSKPASSRQKDGQRLLGLIKQCWLESGGVYGYRKIAHDLRDLGQSCSKHRVYRLMKQEGLQAQVGTGAKGDIMASQLSLPTTG